MFCTVVLKISIIHEEMKPTFIRRILPLLKIAGTVMFAVICNEAAEIEPEINGDNVTVLYESKSHPTVSTAARIVNDTTTTMSTMGALSVVKNENDQSHPLSPLDTVGNFLYAYNLGADPSDANITIDHVTFSPVPAKDTRLNNTVGDATWTCNNDKDFDVFSTGAANPVNLTHPDHDLWNIGKLDHILYSYVRRDNSEHPLSVSLPNLVPGKVYKVQMIFHEKSFERAFTVALDNIPIALDYSPAAAQNSPGMKRDNSCNILGPPHFLNDHNYGCVLGTGFIDNDNPGMLGASVLSHLFIAKKPTSTITLYSMSREDGCEATFSDGIVDGEIVNPHPTPNHCRDICDYQPPIISAITMEEEPAVLSIASCQCHIQKTFSFGINPACSSDCQTPRPMCREGCTKIADACSFLNDPTKSQYVSPYPGWLGNLMEGGDFRYFTIAQLDTETLKCMDATFLDLAGKCPSSPNSMSWYSSDTDVCLPLDFTSETLSPKDGGSCSVDTWSSYFEEVRRVDDHNAAQYAQVPVLGDAEEVVEVNITPLILSLLVLGFYLLSAIDAIQVRRGRIANKTGDVGVKIQPALSTSSIAAGGSGEGGASGISMPNSMAGRLSVTEAGRMSVAHAKDAFNRDHQNLKNPAQEEHEHQQIARLSSQIETKLQPDIASAARSLPSTVRVHSNFTFNQLLGPAGSLAFTSLLLLSCFCLYVGRFLEEAMTDNKELRLEFVVIFYLVGLIAVYYFVNSVVFWRGMSLTLEVELRGLYDPFSALGKLPKLKSAVEFYYANIATVSAGKYSIFLIVGSSFFELLVQTRNAENMATWLDWAWLEPFTMILSLHFIVMGACLSFSWVSASAIAIIDVIFEALYTRFNIWNGRLDRATSSLDFVAVLVPLYLMVEMVNDCYIRLMREHIDAFLRTQELQRNYVLAKRGGTFKELLAMEFNEKVMLHEAEEENNEDLKGGVVEIKEFSEFKATVSSSKSQESDCNELTVRFFVPKATPEQLVTFQKSQLQVKGEALTKIEEVELELGWSLLHGEFVVPMKVMARDFLADQLWVVEDGGGFLAVARSTTDVRFPKKKRMTRVMYFTSGYRFEPWFDGESGEALGTKVTTIAAYDPGGLLPPWYINYAAFSQMSLRIKMFHDYFVGHVNPADESDNGGVWPDDYALSLVAAKEAEERGEEGDEKALLWRAEMQQLRRQRGKEISKDEKRKEVLRTRARRARKILGGMFIAIGLVFGLSIGLSSRSAKVNCAKSKYTKCVWDAFGKGSAHLYFENGFLSGSMCGFGTGGGTRGGVFTLDVSECTTEEDWEALNEDNVRFAFLSTFVSEGTGRTSLPSWLNSSEDGIPPRLREVRLQGNSFEGFPVWLRGDGGLGLELLDIRDNNISSLPFEVADADLDGGELRVGGNPIDVVDWGGKGLFELPQMVEGGAGRGVLNGFFESVKFMRLADNSFGESVFELLADSNLTSLRGLDVSNNSLSGFSGITRLTSLEELAVNDNPNIGVGELLELVDGDWKVNTLEKVHAKRCNVTDVTAREAARFDDFDLDLGDSIKELRWFGCVTVVSGYLRDVPKFVGLLEGLEVFQMTGFRFADGAKLMEGDLPLGLQVRSCEE
ncbi:hypothetical protein TL16_g12068 [Triparma laevis f. inornata]|uniref:START domain-containing protein n=1 Tax=Triparma laevis f. inornata TaxID=1714386 RepID=A0A9W7ETU7_9STRA|nr:hypothetical protein TL16_g12068 [Triparma laevis f. inornata]